MLPGVALDIVDLYAAWASRVVSVKPPGLLTRQPRHPRTVPPGEDQADRELRPGKSGCLGAPEGEFTVPFEELDLAPLAVCLTCGDLRGGAPREQRCRCQPRTPGWQRQWRWQGQGQGQGQDIASDLDLCVLCVRDTVTTRTRWSWLGCETCRHVSQVVGERYGHRSALPLGRHSIMNGDVIQPPVAAATEVAGSLLAATRRWNALREWQQAEFDRLAEPLHAAGPSVQLAEWQRRWPPSLGASVDAFDRYGVVPVPADLSNLRQAQTRFLSSAH